MSKRIRLGWAQRDITPTRPVALRGQFNLRVANRAMDPLTLTVLALDGDDQAVFVSLDLCYPDRGIVAGARAALAQRLPELDTAKMIFCATHTHTAPFGDEAGLQSDDEYAAPLTARYPDYLTGAEYATMVADAVADAVCEAWTQRAPGAVAWGLGQAVVGHNRRARYLDDRAVMYGSTAVPDFSHIEGHVDHDVHLLATYDEAGALTGMVVNLACPSQASESIADAVSADFWHDIREELRGRHGAGLPVLAQCSAAGDLSPHRMLHSRAEQRMLALRHGDEGVGRPLNTALRRDIGRRVADACDAAEAVVRADRRTDPALAFVSRVLPMPHWDLSRAEYDSLQAQMADLERQLADLADADPLGDRVTGLRGMLGWCQRAAARFEQPLTDQTAELIVLRLGDVAFVTAPFEFYLDFGDRIKGRSAALQTFVVQLTAGGPYLATERAAAGLSYGAVPASCSVAPAGGQVLVEAAVATIAELFGG